MLCTPVPVLVPCAGSRRGRAPLPDGGADLDADEKAARNKALGLDPSTSLPKKSGVLNKRGEALFKGWAERLLVLDEMSLRYYDVSHKDADSWPASAARGLIPLSSKSKVHKLEGDLAPRTRGAGLDWKGAVTEGKGMPFCFKIQTDDKEYVFQVPLCEAVCLLATMSSGVEWVGAREGGLVLVQGHFLQTQGGVMLALATNENERSGWISVLHSRVEYLARLDPRAQHQHDIVNQRSSRPATGATSPLSGRSSPAQEEDEDEEDDEEEISDMLMTDGLSAQLKLAVKGQQREEERKRRKGGKRADDASKKRPDHQNRGKGEQEKSGKAWKHQPPPPKGIFGAKMPDISSGWCSAPDMTPSWLRLCDGKGKDAQSEGIMSPVLSPRSGDEEPRFEGQINGTGGRAYQPSTEKQQGKRGKDARHPNPMAMTTAEADAAPTTPGGSPYVEAPVFTKKRLGQAKGDGHARASEECSNVAEIQVQDGNGEMGRGGPEVIVMEALYDFVPEQPDEMQMSVGDRVSVHKEFEDGWCSVKMLMPAGGAKRDKGVKLLVEGIVPRSYLRAVPSRELYAADARERAAAGVFGAAAAPRACATSALPSALKGSRKAREDQQVRLSSPEGGFDDPEVAGGKEAKGAAVAGPVLSLLRKKAMSWKENPGPQQPQQQAGAVKAAAHQGARLESEEEMYMTVTSVTSRVARFESEEEMSPSTEDEEEGHAAAARAAKTGSPNASKPPLGASSSRGRRRDGSQEASEHRDKDKKKSLLSRNPRKMLGKIAARVRSRSASREPAPRSSPP